MMNVIKYISWLFIDAPKKIFTVLYRLLRFINYELSFTVHIRLIFTPLYGDYSLIGRFIGLVLRTGFVVFGLGFILFMIAVTLVAPILWYALIPALIYYLDIWSIPILIGSYFYIVLRSDNIPSKKISEDNSIKTFRPAAKHYLRKLGKNSVTNLRTFLKTGEISKVLYKAELLNKDFENKLSKNNNLNIEKLETAAYEYATQNHSRYVENEHLFLAILKTTENVETLLASEGTSLKILEETVFWIVELREKKETAFFWQDDFIMPPMGGFGHGLTGRVTPNLDTISRDFTKLVKNGQLPDVVGREKEIEKIAESLGGSNENILLVGEPGCGKTSLIMGIANKIMHGTQHKSLNNKRIVSLEMGSLIAGTSNAGAVADRLKRSIEEMLASKDIILFIDEIHNLIAPVDNTANFSTVFSIFEPYLSSNNIQFIGATSVENYRKYIEPIGSFANLFELIEIGEPNFEDTLDILKVRAHKEENKFGISISMPALMKVIQLSEKLIHDRVLPDKAIDILNQGVNAVRNSTKYLTTREIEQVITKMTHIPVTALSADDSKKLLNIETDMKKHVIGQDHALLKIASAIKRARVGIRDEGKPIASFLFVGTTGVGKTETAKTLCETYFGDRKAMIRLDMSEYQTADSIDKLIGKSDGSSKGVLTEQVRSKPFAVILLDEIEKAHHQVILTFLQVLDDARLTDSMGHTIDFTNTIIIATSNAGTKQIQAITQKNGGFKEIEEAATKAVRDRFAPEFLNRFTSIIVFKPLEIDQIKKIAQILLERVKKRAYAKKIKVDFSEGLIDELVKRGYNPEWGARPMARVIEDQIETHIANKMLTGEYLNGTEIKLGTEVFSD